MPPPIRVALSGLCLGILLSALALGVTWTLSNRMQNRLGVTVDGTSLEASFGIPVAAEAHHGATERLRNVLQDNDVSLVGISMGDGPPAVVVHDPSGEVEWLSAEHRQLLNAPRSRTLTIEGSFAERQWREHQQVLYVEDAEVVGVQPRIDSAPYAQVVASLAAAGVPMPGEYVVSSTNPRVVSDVANALAQTGLEVTGARPLPPIRDALQDPLVVVTGFWAFFGTAAVLFHWTSVGRLGARDMYVRHMYGATWLALTRRLTRRHAAPAAAGAVAGWLLSTAVMHLAMRGHLTGAEQVALPIGLVAALVVAVAASLLSSGIAAHQRGEGHRA